jgi:hypothetical protein
MPIKGYHIKKSSFMLRNFKRVADVRLYRCFTSVLGIDMMSLLRSWILMFVTLPYMNLSLFELSSYKILPVYCELLYDWNLPI